MPKKFGANTKQTEARARIEQKKQNEKLQKEKQLEDELWKDDDKSLMRKQQRKDEKDKKKQEVLERKSASKQAYEEEMNSIKPAKVPVPSKVTRAEIAEKLNSQENGKTTKTFIPETPLEENVNRIVVEGEARSIDDAISVLSLGPEKVDKHPERRMKAAYEAFEQANLPKLKAENPNLRLSQLKQMLKKDWMKSPENPLNQRQLAYNSKS